MGSYLTSALSSAGSGLEQAGGALYQNTGLANVAGGLQSLFGGGDEAGRIAALGQPVPQGVDIVGPSSTFTGGGGPGGFIQGIVNGFQGTMNQYGPDIGPAAQTGGGLGQLLAFLERMNNAGGGAGQLQQIVNAATPTGRITRMAPGYQQAQAPQGGLVHGLISAYTGGILDSPKMGGIT